MSLSEKAEFERGREGMMESNKTEGVRGYKPECIHWQEWLYRKKKVSKERVSLQERKGRGSTWLIFRSHPRRCSRVETFNDVQPPTTTNKYTWPIS